MQASQFSYGALVGKGDWHVDIACIERLCISWDLVLVKTARI